MVNAWRAEFLLDPLSHRRSGQYRGGNQSEGQLLAVDHLASPLDVRANIGCQSQTTPSEGRSAIK
jgi:hypothetical protein